MHFLGENLAIRVVRERLALSKLALHRLGFVLLGVIGT